MDSWKGILFSFAFAGLFLFCVLNFGYLLQSTNNVNQSGNILNQPIFNNMNNTISDGLNNLNAQRDNQTTSSLNEQGTLANPSGALILASIFTSFGRFFYFVFGFGSTFLSMVEYIIPVPIFISVVLSIIVLGVIFAFWRFLKIGQ